MGNTKIKKRGKVKTLNVVLVIVGAFLFAFIVTMIITYWKFQSIPDTLCTCVLGTGTAELVLSALIEIVKKKMEKKDVFNFGQDL